VLAWLASVSLFSLALAACVSPPPPGPTAMVAGWDFSAYFADGLLSLDGETFTDRIDANYSDLDASFGAGAGSAAFGTMHLDGQFGSTDTPLDYSDPVVPSAAAPGSLLSNRGAPAGVDFDCFTALLEEGQLFANPLAMTALAPARVVFSADLGSVPEVGRNWSLRFAGKASQGRIPVGVEFSTDGGHFRGVGSVDLGDEEAPFRVPLGAERSKRAWVRFSFEPDPAARQQAFIDNLAIDAELVAPETGATPLAAPEACPPAA